MIKQLEMLLKEVAEKIVTNKNYQSTTTYKEKDVVTQKDIDAERAIIKGIRAFRPKDSFISEEENQLTLTDENTWIIDPIDGTLNFTREIPQYGIQVAYFEHKKPQIGMIYFPNEETILYAEKDKGCFINNKKIELKNSYTLAQSIVTFGDFSRSQPSSRPLQLSMMSDIMDHVMKTRIYGASSTDFGYVIMNKTQAHIIFTKRIWELASGLFMAKEAGLDVQLFSNNGVDGIIVGQNSLTNQILDLCKLKGTPYFK